MLQAVFTARHIRRRLSLIFDVGKVYKQTLTELTAEKKHENKTTMVK